MSKKCELKFCKVEGCKSKPFAKEMCGRHYKHMYIHGKILTRIPSDPNEIKIFENHAEIYLYNRKGKVLAKTKIDIEDVETCSKHKWHLSSDNYVRSTSGGLLHRFLTGNKEIQDHINNDRLDNRRINLRPCNDAQNSKNLSTYCTNTSGAKGVYWNEKHEHYTASITVDGERKHLGIFHDLIEAAEAYNKAAEELHLEFSNLNDIENIKLKIINGEIINRKRTVIPTGNKKYPFLDLEINNFFTLSEKEAKLSSLRTQCCYFGKRYGLKFLCSNNLNGTFTITRIA